MMRKNKDYTIMLDLTGVKVGVEVKAHSIEEALLLASKLNVGDVIADDVEWQNGDARISGIWDHDR